MLAEEVSDRLLVHARLRAATDGETAPDRDAANPLESGPDAEETGRRPGSRVGGRRMTDDYTFEGVPVEPVLPGTSLLVAGPSHAGTREVAFHLLAGAPGEGTIVVTTNQRATRVAHDCEVAGVRLSSDRSAVVSCVGQDDRDEDIDAEVVRVTGPGDLTGIGMRYSRLAEQFHRNGVTRVRTGVISVSTLLSFSDLQTVSRFVHTLVGRVGSVDGPGVFLVDPEVVDERVVSNVAQLCDGRVDVRDDDGPELRVRGLPGQSREWSGVELYA
jgi:hypothetical protein